MKAVVIYKTRYGATKTYADWIGHALCCPVLDGKTVKIDDLKEYDTVIYGGGLYAEIINGVILLTKNTDKLKGKRLVVFTTGLTPPSCREYYDKMVLEKNFKPEIRDNFKIFNFPGKMIVKELSLIHRGAIKTLKKIMSKKENPTPQEKLLIKLCDADGDFCDKDYIYPLLDYVKEKKL